MSIPLGRFPQALHISGNSIRQSIETDDDLRADPRGIVWMFEPPVVGAHYIMGCDPTVGITGWNRAIRTENDHRTDNGAIEIFRVDAERKLLYKKDKSPDIDPVTHLQRYIYVDVQAAEFFAPIDAVEVARVANILGRVYAGDAEDQCEFIYEAYPGPGLLTTQELLRLGYTNLWMWEYIDSIAEETSRIGWRSTRETQRLLWFRSRRHLMERRARILSPWLVNEYRTAVNDPEKQRAKAAYGCHDDLMQAANMCFWGGHKWAYDPERTNDPVSESPCPDPQRTAPVLGEYRSYKDAWADAVGGWE